MAEKLAQLQQQVGEMEKEVGELTNKNRDMAKRLKDAVEVNRELKEYGEMMKHRVTENREMGYNEGKSEALERMFDCKNKDGEFKVPLRKPEIFKTGKNFRHFLQSFQLFAQAAHIPENMKIDTLITFLDPASQMKVSTLNLSTKDKREVEQCYEQIARSIEGTTCKTEARAKLFKLTQKPDETITEYTTKLADLADRCYGVDKSPIKDQILMDCLIGGIFSDQIAIELIKEQITNFEECYKRALDLEGMYALRQVGSRSKGILLQEDAEEENGLIFQLTETQDNQENRCRVCNTDYHT